MLPHEIYHFHRLLKSAVQWISSIHLPNREKVGISARDFITPASSREPCSSLFSSGMYNLYSFLRISMYIYIHIHQPRSTFRHPQEPLTNGVAGHKLTAVPTRSYECKIGRRISSDTFPSILHWVVIIYSLDYPSC